MIIAEQNIGCIHMFVNLDGCFAGPAYFQYLSESPPHWANYFPEMALTDIIRVS